MINSSCHRRHHNALLNNEAFITLISWSSDDSDCVFISPIGQRILEYGYLITRQIQRRAPMPYFKRSTRKYTNSLWHTPTAINLSELESLDLAGWPEIDRVAFRSRILHLLPHFDGLVALSSNEATACLIEAGGEDSALWFQRTRLEHASCCLEVVGGFPVPEPAGNESLIVSAMPQVYVVWSRTWARIWKRLMQRLATSIHMWIVSVYPVPCPKQ